MTELIVVGGGYWGVATVLMARSKGIDAQLADVVHVNSGSRAASGYYSSAWYEPGQINRAAMWAEKLGVKLNNTGAWVYKKKKQKTWKSDWYTFNPGQFLGLVKPDIQSSVVAVGPGFVDVFGMRYQATNVVVAAGVWTDQILRNSALPELGVTGLRGTGIIFKGNQASVELHEINPYRQVALREWGPGQFRVCATLEASSSKTPADYAKAMLKVVEGHVPLKQEVERFSGYRPLVPAGPTVRLVANKVVASCGGGRTGGILAFWAAEQALHLLGLR